MFYATQKRMLPNAYRLFTEAKVPLIGYLWTLKLYIALLLLTNIWEALNGVVITHPLPLGHSIMKKRKQELNLSAKCNLLQRQLLYFDQEDIGGLSLCLQAAHPHPSPSIPIITAYFTDPPSLHRLCTQIKVQMHYLALFLEFVFKFDIFFATTGKRSHENFSSGSYGRVGEKEHGLQQLRFKVASLSFSSVSSRKKMKPNEPKIRIPKSSDL
ncbi:hypothetical protein FF1_028564 [Malus domestica]